MCECVDRNALPAEFCVMKIVPIFVIFLFFVPGRCAGKVQAVGIKDVPLGSWVHWNRSTGGNTEESPQRFFLRLSSPDIGSNNCCFVALAVFRAVNRGRCKTRSHGGLVDVQRPPDCPQLG